LQQQGVSEEARAAYLQVLRLDPTHRGALSHLADLLHHTGYRSAARTVFLQLISHYPNNAVAHVNLANPLRESEDWYRGKRALSAGFEHRTRDMASPPRSVLRPD